jgi:hypothetical protein
MARPEPQLQFLISPPEDEPIFRFGASLRAERAVVWLDGPDVIWLHRFTRRNVSMFHLRQVLAYRADLFGQSVRHLALLPYHLDEGLPIGPSVVFQDRHGPLYEHSEPEFELFASHFLARLKRSRPFLAIEGDEDVLLGRAGC